MEVVKERVVDSVKVAAIACQSLGLQGSLVFLLYLEKSSI